MTKKYFIIALIFLILFFSEIYVLFIHPKFIKKETTKTSEVQQISPDILLLSEPIHWLTGTIEKIEGSTVFIKKSTTPQLSKTYALTLNTNTIIVKIPTPIPYVFKSIPVQNKTQLTLADLRVGQTITALTSTDLRFLQSDTFEVNSIEVQSSIYPLIGVITKISENTMTLSGLNQQSIQSEQTREETYEITISQDTEIYRLSTETLSSPKKLSLSDLSVGLTVSVYYDKEILPKEATPALLVQQLIDTIIPASSSSTRTN